MGRRRRRVAGAVEAPLVVEPAPPTVPLDHATPPSSTLRHSCAREGDASLARHSPPPAPPIRVAAPGPLLSHSWSSSSPHRDAPSVVDVEDSVPPAAHLGFTTSADVSHRLRERPHSNDAAAAAAAASKPRRCPPARASYDDADEQDAVYSRNWSQVVLGATSAIMFLLVLCVGYALYVLVTPYSQSIINGVLLSIVMHPQSRLRSALYMGTAVDRMTRVQQRWAARGRLTGLLGSWVSLRHFVSFVVMQGTFFLGLNKIRVRTQSILLGEATTVDGAAEGARTRCSDTLTSLSPHASPVTLQHASPPPAATAQRRHRRLVATPRGRRVLRWLTVVLIVGTAHLLIGVATLALLHIVLAAVFALTAPVLSATTFVSSMGRLWRVAVVLFFLVGLTLNFTADVLSISEAVRRTTSAVVVVAAGSDVRSPAAAATPAADTVTCEWHVPGSEGQECVPPTLVADDAVPPSKEEEEVVVEEGAERPRDVAAGDASVDVFGVLEDHRSRIEAFVIGKMQDLVVQELADMFSDGNVSQMIETLMQVLPPQLRSMVTGGPSAIAEEGRLGSSGGAPSAAVRDAGSSRVAKASPLSWRAVLEKGRGLRPVSAVKSFVYDSLSGTASRPSGGHDVQDGHEGHDGAAGAAGAAGARAAATGGHKVEIDWLTVSRLITLRLLPYVESALRIFFRVGANLLGLFDSLYAVILFVVFYRYLTQLEHTVLYYGVAKLLRVMQPEHGDRHARAIEQDITASFITLLQSFWHLTWFHFCVTFCSFKMWGLPTPFLMGLVSVVLALFPLVPKWLSPCSVALVCTLVQLGSLTTAAEEAETATAPLLAWLPGQSWAAAVVWGKPYLLHYTRIIFLGLAVVLECGDEWLLCVSRGLRGGFVADAGGKGREQLQPFVVGTALVLGFVAYGTRGIVFGPLTVIVARVLFDNWDVVLVTHATSQPPPQLPVFIVANGGASRTGTTADEEEEDEEEQGNEVVESPECSRA
ncbi:hypothetical protein NESM_000333600 [Novymonas esmeraldas]|uniref:Uncharacterized protein n=1 Tax=Novymonas esmeraldas TaxID=1808958 RepID=A0AAW0EKK3_9TRYP